MGLDALYLLRDRADDPDEILESLLLHHDTSYTDASNQLVNGYTSYGEMFICQQLRKFDTSCEHL